MAKSRKRKKANQPTRSFNLKKYIMSSARKLPLVGVYLMEDIFETGLGNIFVIREMANGKMVMGGYLVDVFCLGIKDTTYQILYPEELEKILNASATQIDPNNAFNIIYGALEYAEDLGFAPHKDFAISEYVLDPVESVEYEELTFGKDGKPLYLAGISDRTEAILNTLRKNVGVGNFEYLCEVNESDIIL